VVEKLKREGESLIGRVNWKLERERRPSCYEEEAIYTNSTHRGRMGYDTTCGEKG
jgi:hypothetical protein